MADEQSRAGGVDPAAQPAPEPRSPKPQTWNLGDVLLIAVMFFVALIAGAFLIAAMGSHYGLDARTLLTDPLVLIPLQAAGYLFTFLCARIVITLKTRRPFSESIEWNYPGAERLPQLLLLGLVVALAVGVVSSFLPRPDHLPVEKYSATPILMVVFTTFGLFVAPLAEELYFRGIFYPALRRSLDDDRSRQVLGSVLILLAVLCGSAAFRGSGTSYALFAPILLGFGLLLMPFRYASAPLLDGERQTMTAIVLTSVMFAYIHQEQLANSWGAVVPILLVGLIITSVRVRLNSVAAGWILHCGYNGTLFLLTWASSPMFHKAG